MLASGATSSSPNAQGVRDARLPSPNWGRLDGGTAAGGSGQGALLVSVGGRRISQIQVEAREKEAQGFAKIYKWEDLKKDLPCALKLSPLTMIPHKSRKYRAILELLYQLMVAGYLLPSVNDATVRTAPEEAMYQVGSVLL